MAQVKWTNQLDPSDGIQLRYYYEALRGFLDSERSTWTPHWEQLSRFFQPRAQRFNWSDSNRGTRMDFSIVDNTGTMAHETLSAGLVSGICPPTRKWFEFEVPDKALNERKEVRKWCEDTGDAVRDALLRSNFYQTVHQSFGEESLFGTTAFSCLEDESSDIRFYPWPIGSYYLTGDETGRIDLFLRVVQMTTRQLVAKFGFDNCSTVVQTHYTSNAGGMKDQWWPVVNVVHKSSYYGLGFDHQCTDECRDKHAMMAEKPWTSVWYEQGSFGNLTQGKGEFGILKRDGFWECPIIAARWSVTGEDHYGKSPAMNALGDVMGLQLLSMRTTQAIDKMVDPPMVASPSMANQKMSILPGDVTFADSRDGSHGFRPAFEIKYDVDHAGRREEEHRRRINAALYKDLFLMISGSDRRQVTAEEIRAKMEEKMLVLGPVLERNNDELLEPVIKRVLGILSRRGKIAPMPESLQGKKVRVQFTSLLAQAQRMLGLGNIQRFMEVVGQESAVNQGVFDIVNLDEAAREAGRLLNIPSRMLRDKKEVDAIRQNRAIDMQRQQQAENAQKLAAAAKNLGDTNTSGQNGLTDLIQSQYGVR